jgi:uncharacterized membrane protein YjfL (UPF0719 family)
MDLYVSLEALVSALIFVFAGLLVFHFVFRIAAKSAVASFRDEIVEKQNVALALLVGLLAIALSVIIAAAVH